ncbi:uncharacterized protein LOC124775988 [Schistocerca piceifrons]|uniref:uncharacterized protein LOC124775988 n=1 Tax=Schistocerca piceifrons TaxID=274613 RepID=UPI001F5E40F1|nr:uncharacterized protein LOC124775988 [Schistocerca piceifrons]
MTLWKKLITPSVFWFFVILAITFIALYSHVKLYRNISQLITLTYIGLDIVSSLKVLLTMGICMTTGLRELRLYGKELKNADALLVWKKSENVKMLGGFLLGVNLVVVVALLATIAQNSNGLREYLEVIFSLFLDCMTTLQFVVLELELWVRFCSLNTRLLEVIPVRMTSASLEGASQLPPLGRLRQLLEAYTALRHGAQHLQKHFGVPVAVSVAKSLCCSTCSAYEVLLIQLRPQWAEQLPLSPSVGNSLMFLTLRWLQLTIVALSCAAVEDAAATTGEILLWASVVCKGRCSDLEAFLPVISHGPRLHFSAAGFFIVNRRLIVSALAIVITYLVILGQLTPIQ